MALTEAEVKSTLIEASTSTYYTYRKECTKDVFKKYFHTH